MSSTLERENLTRRAHSVYRYDDLVPGDVRAGTAVYDREMVGDLLGIFKERVRQIEAVALRKIRIEIRREAELAGVSPEEWLLGG